MKKLFHNIIHVQLYKDHNPVSIFIALCKSQKEYKWKKCGKCTHRSASITRFLCHSGSDALELLDDTTLDEITLDDTTLDDTTLDDITLDDITLDDTTLDDTTLDDITLDDITLDDITLSFG